MSSSKKTVVPSALMTIQFIAVICHNIQSWQVMCPQ